MVSDYRLRGIKRRDARHTKAEVRPQGGSKKDTKKWCRGVVGREHKLECKDHHTLKGWKNLECTACGKVLDYWTGDRWARFWNSPKPDWVK